MSIRCLIRSYLSEDREAARDEGKTLHDQASFGQKAYILAFFILYTIYRRISVLDFFISGGFAVSSPFLVLPQVNTLQLDHHSLRL